MIRSISIASLLIAMGISACKPSVDPQPPRPASSGSQPSPPATSAIAPTSASAPAATVTSPPLPLAERLILAQWRKAENRASCAPLHFRNTAGAVGTPRPAAPLHFRNTAGAVGTPRPARFSGGWAVAWDQGDQRGMFGIAGVAILPQDGATAKDQRARLTDQWPIVRGLPHLPQPAFAGYGIEGASPYPADNPEGYGSNSLAYVRIGGQTCTYNVWSRLGRAHLEALLENLEVLPVN